MSPHAACSNYGRPCTLEAMLCNKRSHHNENRHHNQRIPPAHCNQRKSPLRDESPAQPKINKQFLGFFKVECRDQSEGGSWGRVGTGGVKGLVGHRSSTLPRSSGKKWGKLGRIWTGRKLKLLGLASFWCLTMSFRRFFSRKGSETWCYILTITGLRLTSCSCYFVK